MSDLDSHVGIPESKETQQEPKEDKLQGMEQPVTSMTPRVSDLKEQTAGLPSSSLTTLVSKADQQPSSSDMDNSVTETEKWQPQGEGIGLSVPESTGDMPSTSNGQQQTTLKRPAQALDSGETPVMDSPSKKKKTAVVNPVGSERKSSQGSPAAVAAGKDQYCWYCHKEKCVIVCKSCPRSFHGKCLTTHNHSVPKGSGSILCPECNIIIETTKVPPKPLRKVPIEELNDLILMAVTALKDQADPSFHVPVVTSAYEGYQDMIVFPFSFKDMEDKCINREYKTPFAYFADIKWILHNCAVYNGQCPLTTNARGFVKTAQNKLYELETCPDCFRNTIQKPKTYFSETCRRPHTLVMARVAGHPFWPAKIVDINKQNHEADVRFFGGHER